jgi:hypothetical protein
MKKLLALLFALLASPVAAQNIPAGAWGSINYWGVGGLSQVLAPGLAGQCLTSQNVGSAPVWVNCQVSSLSLLPSIGANSIMANNTLNFVPPQAIDVNRVLDMVGYDIIRPPLPESIIYKSNVGPNFNWQTLPPGTTGQLLTSGGPTNPPFWSPTATQANLASICQTVGAVLYFDTPSLLWKCLAPGTSGQLLQTGGPAGNPSWLTVTLATLGGVPSTRNVNTTAPLGGGGALSADLTLTCPTCATTTNGGALSAVAPVTLSAAGVIAMTNQGTTTTVLHGNAAGNPSFGSVVSADMNITASACTNQFVTAISAAGVGTCTTDTLASAQHANQGTTTTVLHGNAAGNPSFGTVALATDVSGTLPAANLPAGVDTNVLAGGAVITSAPTVDSTFCGKTAALGGNAQFAFTVGAASGFTANCVLTVANVDGWASGRGKQLSISGITPSSNILYPTQGSKFRNINNVWVQDPAYQMVQAPLNQKLFLDPAGSDTNDCLATGTSNACATLGHVVMGVIWGQLLGTGGSATGGNATFDVRLATNSSCVPTTGVNCYSGLHWSGALKQVEGNNSITVECDGGSATNCTIADNTGNCAIGAFNAADFLEIKNVTLAGGSGNNCDIEAAFGAHIRVEGGVVLNPTGSSSVAQLQADNYGLIVVEGGTTTTIAAGTSGYLAFASSSGSIYMDAATFSFSGNVTYGQQTLSAVQVGIVNATSVVWTLNAHTITAAHNINSTTGGWVNTNGGAASVPGTNSPLGTLTSAGSYN